MQIDFLTVQTDIHFPLDGYSRDTIDDLCETHMESETCK